MKKQLLRILICAALALSLSAGALAAGAFTDVQPGDWFYDDVMRVVELGLIEGTSPTTYDPASTLTYAQAIKLGACLHQRDRDGAVTLEKGADAWYTPYLEYALKNGLLNDDVAYRAAMEPNAAITRYDFVSIFYRALPPENYAPINDVPDDSIPDVKAGTPETQNVYTFYRAGILTGSDAQGTFGPATTILRSEVAAILNRMTDPAARKSITLQAPPPVSGDFPALVWIDQGRMDFLRVQTDPQLGVYDYSGTNIETLAYDYELELGLTQAFSDEITRLAYEETVALLADSAQLCWVSAQDGAVTNLILLDGYESIYEADWLYFVPTAPYQTVTYQNLQGSWHRRTIENDGTVVDDYITVQGHYGSVQSLVNGVAGMGWNGKGVVSIEDRSDRGKCPAFRINDPQSGRNICTIYISEVTDTGFYDLGFYEWFTRLD